VNQAIAVGPLSVRLGADRRLGTIAKTSLPDRFFRDTTDDAPETRSEQMFTELCMDLPGPT
jgi:hypothetical protein